MSKRTQTLRGRLTTLVIVAIFGAVAIATASSVWRETAQFSAAKRAELNASAHIFATTVAEPVAMRDKEATLKALRAISFLPTIEHVRISGEDDAVFVELGSAAAASRKAEQGLFQENSPLSMLASGTASASAPIRYGEETVATLTLNASTGSLWERIGTLLYDALVAAIFAGGIGMLIAMKMQRAITDPIQRLGLVMGHVRESGDFSVRADPVEDEETNQLVETFNTMLDHIQERDSKLQVHQRNLEKTVELRTREMRAAKDAAEAANVAKSDFLATMSHEIRTPMNGMLAMADLLSKARLAPRHKRYAEVIAKSGQSLLAIINDILDFSKIEAGKLELETIPVRPADIVDDVVGLFWERAASKHIDLAAYVAANTPEEIEGDPVRISQVLSNLVNNALKFTDHGHVVVGVALKSGGGADGECTLEFSVTDTGVGIEKDKQASIFEAFSQGDQTTTRRFGGTGLGLAICRRLVEAMNGKIGVKSRPGKGSRFFFSTTTKMLEPARPVRQVKEEKRAVIAIEGDATPKMLAHYLRETGVIPHIVEEGGQFGPHIACADMIFASPPFYHVYQQTISEGKAQWVPARVCICELGDVAPDALVEEGVVEDILLAPLSRREVMDQVGRIIDGAMRGKTALATTETAAANRLMFRGQRVLAADDSAINREVVKEAMARLNLNVTLANDGREALALVKSEPFDLILMDCSMPKMDGFEATQAIRALEERTGRQRVPIVALTAHVAGKDEAWRQSGMDDYLTKPFTLDGLSGIIAKYLEGDEGRYVPADDDAPAPRDDQTAPEEDAVFDRSVLTQIAAMQSGAGNLPLRTLEMFQEHSEKTIRTLAEELRTGDAEAIAKAAHALKSLSVNVGAQRLGAACGDIEAEARAGAPKSTLNALCKKAAAEYREAHRALPGLMQEYKKSAA